MNDEIIQNNTCAARTAEYYDKLWAEDSRSPEEFVQPESFGEARLQFLCRSLSKLTREQHEPFRILDLGCGTGWIETFISQYGNVTAIDFSPKTISFAQQRYSSHADFLVANPMDPRLGIPEDVEFDVVVSSEVIEHVQHPAAYVRQINGFLRPGGWCLMTTPNAVIWNDYRVDERYRQSHQPVENWLWPKEITALFRSQDFRVLHQSGWANENYAYHPVPMFLTKKRVRNIVELLRLSFLWRRIMLHYGVLQFLIAQKDQL